LKGASETARGGREDEVVRTTATATEEKDRQSPDSLAMIVHNGHQYSVIRSKATSTQAH
jgi:hypothetical protein